MGSLSSYCLACFHSVSGLSDSCYWCNKPRPANGYAEMEPKRLKKLQAGFQYDGTPWNAVIGKRV